MGKTQNSSGVDFKEVKELFNLRKMLPKDKPPETDKIILEADIYIDGEFMVRGMCVYTGTVFYPVPPSMQGVSVLQSIVVDVAIQGIQYARSDCADKRVIDCYYDAAMTVCNILDKFTMSEEYINDGE